MRTCKGEGKNPIIVGATGHRDLRAQDIPVLEAAVRACLAAIRARCPDAPLKLMTGLAEGADQLCARVALEMGMALLAPMPWTAEVFRQDFQGEALQMFDRLLAAAESAYVTPPVEPFARGKDYAYRQVGIHLARHCHVLIALWDGRPGRPDGCGTAETVDFMRYHSYRGGEDRRTGPGEGVVLHIVTPRRQNPDVPGVGTWRVLGADPG